MSQILTLPGVFSRVLWTPRPRKWVWVRVLPDKRTVECSVLATGEVLWTHVCPPGVGLAHPDAAANPFGDVRVVAQSFSDDSAMNDRLAVVTQAHGVVVDPGVEVSGQEGVMVRWNGRNFVTFSKRGDGRYWRQEDGQPATDHHQTYRDAEGFPTAQGFLDGVAGLALDGSEDRIKFVDEYRFLRTPALSLIQATERAGVVFGQEFSTANRLSGLDPIGAPFLLAERLGFYPRLAVNDVADEWAATWANSAAEHGETVSAALLPPFPVWTAPSEELLPPPADAATVPDLPRARHSIAVTVVDPRSSAEDPFDFYDTPAKWAAARTDTSMKSAIFYTDAHRPHPDMLIVAEIVAESGRDVAISWNTYPSEGLSADDIVADIRAGFEDVDKTGLPCEPWLGLWRGLKNDGQRWLFAWSGQTAIDVAAFAWARCVERPKVRRVFVWALRRGPGEQALDGVASFAPFQQFVEAIRRPPVSETPDTAETPETHQPATRPTTPGRKGTGTGDSRATKIGAGLVAAFAALAAIFGRKKQP